MAFIFNFFSIFSIFSINFEGVDTHFDTSIGKQFSALGHTLTGLTGGEEEDNSAGAAEAENLTGPSTDDDEDDPEASEMNENGEQVPIFVLDMSIFNQNR